MKQVRQIIASLLLVAMVFSMVACGKQNTQETALMADPAATTQGEYTREEMELIVDLIGDGQPTQNMTDEELQALVDQIITDTTGDSASQIVDLNAQAKEDLSAVDMEANKGAYNEDGSMNTPFDQVYPELIEKDQVAFSGESILIKMKNSTLTDGLKTAGVGALEKIVPMEGSAWYEAKLTEGTDAETAMAKVRELKEVLLAEYNYEVSTALAPNTVLSDNAVDGNGKGNGNNKPKEQWHLKSCGIPNGYGQMKNSGGDSGTVVAVIDTGVDYNHEDLKDNIWVNTKEIPDNGRDDDGNGYVDDYYGVDIVDKNGNADDTNGHGTHVAGIIAAQNNKLGVVGIAFNVKIMPIKAATHSGTLNQADIAKAVLYAFEMGAEVINMSFGGTACSIAVQDALATAYKRCVLVASAGNNGYPNEKTDYYLALPNYPAALSYVVGVMSVDSNGVESVFSNWDVEAFNGIEYELYAPGEAIVSTLPNNTYGALSGTSMAAPMVSAIAAILRGEFSDRDKYPNKFIYGQLASTSDNYATCCDPKHHTINGDLHNIPQIVNLYTALTELPKPEVGVQEYYLFDDPKYSKNNNGDGVIDAGETIALGLTLRNRWGMSENTQVTIDTLSNVGMEDPYITIQNPTVDYGSVGTYSTQDCGKIYTDELFTGLENPFLITISEDCPNDYLFTIHITIRCENALDESDRTTYVTKDKMEEYVRAGTVLPSVIEEDMTLTKDKLYIIPNATVINEGVTVRVQPGTHIQFWSDDADDPYAGSYIAYLLVNGQFLVEGTKEEPVYIYPSQLMSKFGVEIGSSNTGYVSLKYADITNFFVASSYSYADHTGTDNRIDLADHCTFRNNYGGNYIYYRYLSSGVVKESSASDGTIGTINAQDCVFYKLAFYGATNLYGSFDRCIFTQCGITFRGAYDRCVFLGNRYVDQTNPSTYKTSSLSVNGIPTIDSSDFTVYYRPETGTTYVRYRNNSSWSDSKQKMDQIGAYIEAVFGGSFFVAETMEEYNWVKSRCPEMYVNNGKIGGRYTWSDGTPLQPEFLPLYISSSSSGAFLYLGGSKLSLGTVSTALYEIPGHILPEDITFATYTADIDLETTYQIAPQNTPVQLPLDAFLYESADETVLTVSDTGLVTPVGLGTADVWVWSQDKAIRNRVTITVRDYVALEELQFPAEAVEIAAGETQSLSCVLTPANTTRRNVIYTSSDEAVARVDDAGNITGIASGTATITASCEGLTDTVTIRVYTKATALELENLVCSAALSEGAMDLPGVITNPGAEPDLSWRSTDESVAIVENGKLTLKANGTTSVIVTDRRSGLSAACLVVVSQTAVSAVREVLVKGHQHWALLENGDLYLWGAKPTLVETNVAAIQYDSGFSIAVALLTDGTIRRFNRTAYADMYTKDYTQVQGWNITDFAFSTCGSSDGDNFFVLTEEGNAYAWGKYHPYGQLGVGVTGAVKEPTLINLDGIVDIEAAEYSTWFLTEKGELYAAGKLNSTTTATPILIDTNVAQIQYINSNGCYYLSTTGMWKCFTGHISTYTVNLAELDAVAFGNSSYSGIGIKDGRVYTFECNSNSLTEVPGIQDAVDVFTYEDTQYIVTESGLLFALGNNPTDQNHTAGASKENPLTTPVLVAMQALTEETIAITQSNLQEEALAGDSLELSFNKALSGAAPKLYADGVQVTVQSAVADYNRLIISRASGFAENVRYELVLEVGSLTAIPGIVNTQELRIPFTYVPGTQAADPQQPAPEQPAPEEAPVIYDAIVDETVERILTVKTISTKLNAYLTETQHNVSFYGNAILNPISTDFEVSHWLRPLAPTISSGTYSEIPLGGNWWGTTNETAIGLQMVDYTDFITYARLMYAPYLTEAPENTFPFVTSVKLFNKDGDQVTTVGNETITFQVTFNRDMDTSIPLQVTFGSAYPYGDYQISGQYVNARTWEGTYTLNTLIENGLQYFSISNGCSATDDLALQLDEYRFSFEIDTTAAQALIMQGTATDTGIELRWTQDDFDTLMGYNVYRSTKEDGLYTRVNTTTIPADTLTFFDDTVEPGVVYYYNFTVVKTDLTESEPSGKIIIMSKDTMAPNIYHSPVANAFTGANLVLNATVTDNLNIVYANLYYRTAGTEAWKIIRMNNLNDKYSAIIPAANVTVAGIEYYIEAFDGISYTYKGSADAPFTILVQEAIDDNALGDVDGDGAITNLDAVILLYAINDKYNMTAEEFARADLNGDGELWAAEALRILQYVSGVVGSVKM